MWTKTVDERLKNHFQMTDSKDAFNAEMHKAYNDFEHALTHLLGYEQVQKGTIYMCSSKNATQNNHLAIEGQFTDILSALKQSSLLHWLYFRCLLLEKDNNNKLGILADQGLVNGHIEMYSHPLDRIVLRRWQKAKKSAGHLKPVLCSPNTIECEANMFARLRLLMRMKKSFGQKSMIHACLGSIVICI